MPGERNPDSSDANAAAAIVESGSERENGLLLDGATRQLQEKIVYDAQLIDNISDAVISAGSDYTIRSWNKAAERIHGWTSAEAIGQRADLLLKTSFTSTTAEETWQRLQEMNRVDVEIVQTHKDGRPLQFEASVTLIRNCDGEPTGVVAILHDITERKRAEQETLRKNAVLNGINSILQCALNSETEEGIGQICLQVAEQITGSDFGVVGEFGADGVLHQIATSGQGLEGLLTDHYEAYGTLANSSFRALCGQVLEDCKSLIVNDPIERGTDAPVGSPRLESFLGTPLILGGRTIGLIAVCKRTGGYSHKELESLEALAPAIMEALHRKRAEMAVSSSQKQNELLARTLELSSQAFDIGFPDGRLGLVNHAFELLTGYSAEELKSISWSEHLTPPEWLEIENKKLMELNRTGQPMRYEKEYIRKNGTRVPVELLVHVAKDADGNPLYYYSFINDITDRKRTEQAIIRSEKLASLGRMAATIAHEINNPLAAVTNALFLAKSSLDDRFSLRLYLEMADEELRRVAHITRQALGFYRESTAPAETSLNELVDSVLDLLKSRIVASGASIECEYETGLTVTCVGGEIRQVLSNLLTNSLDAISERGAQGIIKLRVSSTQSIKSGKCFVRVTVMDNGRGLNRAAQSHIFEPFFTTKQSRGTGLGLWVCKQLVDKHGGSIKLRSYTDGPRQGTTFSVNLPVEG